MIGSIGQQQPMPSAPPAVATQPLAPTQRQLQPPPSPDPGKGFRGWYPRWWLLSAFLCGALIGFVQLTQTLFCGSPAVSPLCQFNSWTDWRQGAIVGVVWLIFILGWFAFYTFGVVPIEIQRARDPLTSFLRAISQYRSVYALLLVFSFFALLVIFATWLLNLFNALAFALLSLIIFVTNAHFLYRKPAEDRQRYMIAYGILAVGGAVIMVIARKPQPVLLASAAIIFLMGARSVWMLFRSPDQSPPAQQLTPEERLAQVNAQALTSGEIFRALMRSILGRPANPPTP